MAVHRQPWRHPAVPAATLSAVPWPSGPAPEEIHIWLLSLDVDDRLHAHLAGTLSDEERARAQGFRFRVDRERFVVARGFLRGLLGRYLDLSAPQTLRFRYECVCGRADCATAWRRPALAPEHGAVLDFNLSHSGGLALVAVARGRRVGVDLERIDAAVVSDSLAGECLSEREHAAFRALPDGARPEAFYRQWTRKEACAKASGLGLLLPLGRLEVSSLEAEVAGGTRAVRDRGDGSVWGVEDLDPAPGYVGAVAADGVGWRVDVVRCYALEPQGDWTVGAPG